jgi:hypothetical protein
MGGAAAVSEGSDMPSSDMPSVEVEVEAPPPLLPGLTATGLDLPPGLRFDQWERVGAALGAVIRAMPWAVADWLHYGERTYGETYAQAIEVTRLNYQTLANLKSVASRIERSRRRESLSFAHHAEVASLEPAVADAWLARAAEEGWSARELRGLVRQAKSKPWDVDEALDHLRVAVRAIAHRWPPGEDARQALGRQLCILGEHVLAGGDLT